MYLGHFHLREAPFSITPDTDFFYPHEEAQAALNMLLVALRSGEGFLKIVGEVGCGKTMLCRQLLKTLEGEFVTTYIPNPSLSPDALLMALLDELGVSVSPNLNRDKAFKALHDCLLTHAAQGRRVVVCIDEAQATPLRTLESLRLVSNLETEKQKLLQLVLMGQPELDTKLSRPEIRQLLQRITFSEYIGPMMAHRVPGYLEHRLATAALGEGTDTQIFDADAAKELAILSGGVPRLINLLANKCLMLAYGEKMRRINLRHVRLAASDTPGVRSRVPWWWWWEGVFRKKRPGDRKASEKQFKDYFFRRFTVSVINKMLRDLDSRRAPDKLPEQTGKSRTGLESNTLLMNDSDTAGGSRSSLSFGAVLAISAVVLAVAAGPWWYLNQSGFLQHTLAQMAPLASPPISNTDKPPAATVRQVTKQPVVMASVASPVAIVKSKPAVVPAPTPQPKPAVVKSTAVAAVSTPTQSSPKARAPIERVVSKQPVVSAPVKPAASPPAPQRRSPVLEALAQAQSLWQSGSRRASMSLLRDALAAAERANPVGAASADHSELVLLARELARMDLVQGQPGPALAMLRRLEPALSGFADVWAIRGNAAQRLGRHQESATAYLRALKLRPDEPRWMLGAAVSLAAQGQIEKATELAEKARIGGVLSTEVAAYLRQLGVDLPEF